MRSRSASDGFSSFASVSKGEPWTLEAIGHELDLTRERVRQLEGQALSRLAALRELASLAAA